MASLNNWPDFFKDYIVRNYSDYLKYLNGEPPDLGEGVESLIKTTPPNYVIAWTWEGRVPKGNIKKKLRITNFFLSDEKMKHSFISIQNLASLNLKEKETVIRWMKTSTTWCDNSIETTYKANDLISRGI